MAGIITITFNPCIDKSTTITALVPEKKLQCSAPVYEPGGGGLNVARAIKKLGGDALAIYPAGGHAGAFLRKLVEAENIPAHVVPIHNNTRENLIVVDQSTNQQYRFGMPGPEMDEQEWQACMTALEQQTAVQYIIASGSLPPGVPIGIYARMAELAHRIGARLIVDTSGEALLQAAQAGVFLLKPNLAELSALAGKPEISAERVDSVALEVINSGKCEALLVSLGATGAMLITKEETVQVLAPVVKRKSTVGAGDSMVAGLVLSLFRGKSLREAVPYGVACGTAATMNPGTELCNLRDVEMLTRLIRQDEQVQVHHSPGRR
jgi:6-phosphofructokinase 2